MRAKGKGFWMAAYPVDPNTGLTEEFLFCSANRKTATLILDDPDRIFLPYLETYPDIEIRVFDGSFTGEASTTVSNLEIGHHQIVATFNNFIWDGAKVILWKGKPGETDWNELEQIFEGVMDGSPEVKEGKCSFKLLDKSYLLDKGITLDIYEGTGNKEGPIEMKGVYKPLIYGSPINVEPILINAPYVVFQYHGGINECDAISDVWENGISFGPAAATVAWNSNPVTTFADLIAEELEIGEWADCPSLGMFRLGGEPKSGGVITCDPNRTGMSLLKDVLNDLVTNHGGVAEIDTASLNAIHTASHEQTVSDYIVDEETIRDLLTDYLSQVGGYMLWDQEGEANFGLVRMGTPALLIRSDGTTYPVVQDSNSNAVSAPYKRLRLGADKSFRVHNTSEVSDALLRAIRAAADAYFTQNVVVLPVNGDNEVTDYTTASVDLKVIVPGDGDYSSNFVLSTAPSGNPQGLDVVYTGQNVKVNDGIDANEDVAILTVRATGQMEWDGIDFDRVILFTKGLPDTNQNNNRNDDPIADPTIPTDGTSVDHVLNADASVDVSFEWQWAGDEQDIDGFEVCVIGNASGTPYTIGSTPSAEDSHYMLPNKRALILKGLNSVTHYTFYVRAYRIVDFDVGTDGIIFSNWVKPSLAGENPYQPSTSTAFSGNIIGTIDGVGANIVAGATANFNARNDRIATAVTAPTVLSTGAAVDHVTNDGGITVDISFEWGWSGSEALIDGFEIMWVARTSSAAYTVGSSPAIESSIKIPADRRAHYLMNVSPTLYYTFYVRAFRVVDPDVNANEIIYSSWVKSTLAAENPYRPSASIAYTGNVTGTINGVAANEVSATATNFNLRNDRNNAAISAVSFAGDGSTIDHTQNTDGSVDISLEWTWGGVNTDIDGFEIMVVGRTSATAYTVGSNPAIEDRYFVPATVRALFLQGVAADLRWTFAVRPFRYVDFDVNANNVINGNWAQPFAVGENPYYPSNTVAFSGNITGTVSGMSASDVANGAGAANNGLNPDGTVKTGMVLTDAIVANGISSHTKSYWNIFRQMNYALSDYRYLVAGVGHFSSGGVLQIVTEIATWIGYNAATLASGDVIGVDFKLTRAVSTGPGSNEDLASYISATGATVVAGGTTPMRLLEHQYNGSPASGTVTTDKRQTTYEHVEQPSSNLYWYCLWAKVSSPKATGSVTTDTSSFMTVFEYKR